MEVEVYGGQPSRVVMRELVWCRRVVKGDSQQRAPLAQQVTAPVTARTCVRSGISGAN